MPHEIIRPINSYEEFFNSDPACQAAKGHAQGLSCPPHLCMQVPTSMSQLVCLMQQVLQDVWAHSWHGLKAWQAMHVHMQDALRHRGCHYVLHMACCTGVDLHPCEQSAAAAVGTGA